MDQNGSFVSPYMSPQTAAAQREYAKALMTGSGDKGPQFKNVQSWTQGVSNMVNALMGGNALYGANQADQARITHGMGQPAGTPSQPSFDEGPSSEGQTKSDDMSTPSPGPRAMGAGAPVRTAGLDPRGMEPYIREEAAKYGIDPDTAVKVAKSEGLKTFLGDQGRSGGAFQLYTGGGMGNDFQKETGLNPLDPANEKATIDYALKHVPQTGWSPFHGAARVGVGPHEGIGIAQASMPSASPAAFTGTGDSSQAPAVQAINSAIGGGGGGGTQVAQNTPVAARGGGGMPRSPMPQPNGTGIYIDPRLVTKRPQMSLDQMQALMNSPDFDSGAKAQLLQQYQNQNQPIEVPYQGGKVIIDPNNPTRQQFVAPEVHWGESQIGDIHGQRGFVPNGQGGVTQLPISRPPVPGPQSQAAPTAAPGGTPTPTPVTAQSSPAAPAAPTNPIQATAFAGQSAQGGVPGMPAASQGTTGVAPSKNIIPVANPQSPTSPFEKFAQSMPAPPGVDPEDWAAYTQKKSFDIKQNVDEDAQKKSAEFGTKRYYTVADQGQAARKQMVNLDLALSMMNDPNMHQGLLHGAQDAWARFKAAAFGPDSANANAPNEAFDKIMAQTVLGGIKDVGGGQIRNAEITLLGKANANRNNTDASNRAVITASRRSLEITDNLSQIGQEYASGNEVHDPLTGKTILKENIGPDGEVTPRHGLDAGYDKLAKQYLKDHPAFTPEEIKNYETIFETGKDPNAPPEVQQPNEQGKGPQQFQVPPKEAIELLKSRPETRSIFEGHFGPADKYLK
jgi:hypothetical protein